MDSGLIAPDSPLEAVPLPAPLKRRLMRVFLRDVHHYLFNATFRPRPGETYQALMLVWHDETTWGSPLGLLTERQSG